MRFFVARRAHDNGIGRSLDPDGEGLFSDEGHGFGSFPTVFHNRDGSMATIHNALPFQIKPVRLSDSGQPRPFRRRYGYPVNIRNCPGLSTAFPIATAVQFFLDNGVGKFNISYFSKLEKSILFSQEDGDMYAVVATGGKQYKVEEGDILRFEKLAGDVGSAVAFDKVLIFSDGENVKIGQPDVDGVTVHGQIVSQGKSKKILVFKFKRRKRYRRKLGHRQPFTAVRIDRIEA
jgi:large subunit ribosomal protein L21